MNAPAKNVLEEKPTGLEDVTRSVRALARATRSVGESAADVIERELAMAINISEQIRDRVISPDMLAEARSEGLPARLREDAHRALDLVADVGSIAYTSLLEFLERFTDERRPALASAANRDTLTQARSE